MYYVVRPTMVTSETFFLSLFPKQHSITMIHITFPLYYVLQYSIETIGCRFHKGLAHPQILVSLGVLDTITGRY